MSVIRNVILCLAVVTVARAGDRPVAAADAVDLAATAARAWADDARLVYAENDEAVDADGRAARWGFLFHSTARDAARAYSIGDGEVERAEDLSFDFAAPPLASTWLDSDEALRHAEEAGGADYRGEHGATLRAMVLTRGLFHLDEADRTTWTCVYDAPGQPSLWIVLDARDGDVLRRWKG